jgi:large subunit ribosomal protein L13
MGNGDFVIVVNASRVTVSGNLREKKYWRHSQYPGGLKSITQEKLLATRPERVVEYAVKGMLPHNSHGAGLLRRLKVYAGPEHPHQAQVNAGRGKDRAAKEAGG